VLGHFVLGDGKACGHISQKLLNKNCANCILLTYRDYYSRSTSFWSTVEFKKSCECGL